MVSLQNFAFGYEQSSWVCHHKCESHHSVFLSFENHPLASPFNPENHRIPLILLLFSPFHTKLSIQDLYQLVLNQPSLINNGMFNDEPLCLMYTQKI